MALAAKMSRLILISGFAALVAASLTMDSLHAQQNSSNDLFNTFSKSLTAVPNSASLKTRGSFYVPAFSSVRMETGKTRLDLAVTLSIHNSSQSATLVLNRIDYFDTAGALIQRYLPHAIALRPLGTIEIFVGRDDVRGGLGANFMVDWAATGPITEPVIDAVMLGSVGTNSYAFAVQGRPIRIESEQK